MENFKIITVDNNLKGTAEKPVVEEVPFTIIVNDQELVTILTSPFDLKDLARGFLFSSGIISDLKQITKLTLNQKDHSCYINLNKAIDSGMLLHKRMYTSGCGKGTLFHNTLDKIAKRKVNSDLKISPTEVTGLLSTFLSSGPIYLNTRGVHSAAIANKKDLKIFREDIGRHNAVDKVIGKGLVEKIDFSSHILLTSGRISSEVIFKMQRADIGVVISKSAPTNQAVRHARESQVTIIASVRGQKFNIYSIERRVLL